MRLLFYCSIFIFIINFPVQGQTNSNFKNEYVELEYLGNGIYSIQSCFDNKIRKKTKNNSQINSQWQYEEDSYFNEKGCYKIISRKKPEEEEILNHLRQITTSPNVKFSFIYKNYTK